ncbi:hypothetical protein H5T88_01335 [bacterium]|nr:hypothetical protein [bacterium]
MNEKEKRFYLFSSLLLCILPAISYPFGFPLSLGFLLGIATGMFVFSYFHFLVNFLFKKGKGTYLWLSLIPRLAFLGVIAFLLGIYQSLISPLTFTVGFAIITFVILFSHFKED